jgi:predicted DNA-binding transcriptional regulator YafY
MPKQAKESTILRQHELLRMLTISRSSSKDTGRWDKASELKAKLQDLGHDVSLRTIQRDLMSLSQIYSIEKNDKNPRDYGWRWIKNARININEMGTQEALALSMTQMHLAPLLPKVTLEALDPLFDAAISRLERLNKSGNKNLNRWADKIRVVQPSLTFIAPDINQEIQEILHQALLEAKKVYVSYQAIDGAQAKEYELNPLGLIVRGAVHYLVATAKDYTKATLYALHRFHSATVLSQAAKTPESFNIDDAINNGLGGFASSQEKISLTIRVSTDLAAYLRETPLSMDQEIFTDSDDKLIVKATVNQTWQLTWWLLSQGRKLEVCEPQKLRDSIKAELGFALDQYK